MLRLSPEAIASALANEADQAGSTALMTYNFAGPQHAPLWRWRNLRIIMGISPEDERSMRSVQRIQGLASINHTARVRLLLRSHVKLSLFWRGSRVRAMLSSMNGVAPSNFREIGILITGDRAAALAHYFEQSWTISTPVNPLDLKDVVRTLGSSVFEVAGTDPKPSKSET